MSVEQTVALAREGLKGQGGVVEVDFRERDALRVRLVEGGEFDLVGFRPGELNSRSVQGMYAHAAATYEELAKETLARAGELWAQDRTKEAELLKELARDYEKRGKEKRQQQAAEKAKFA